MLSLTIKAAVQVSNKSINERHLVVGLFADAKEKNALGMANDWAVAPVGGWFASPRSVHI